MRMSERIPLLLTQYQVPLDHQISSPETTFEKHPDQWCKHLNMPINIQVTVKAKTTITEWTKLMNQSW